MQVPAEPVLLLLLRHAPFDAQRIVLERLFREAYPEALRDGAFEPLRDRWLRMEVLAAGTMQAATGWNVTYGAGGLQVVADRDAPLKPDVRIAACLDDFVLLANQRADPDTLFFQRRLVIDGDTALGLVIKNVIFGNELTGFPATAAHWLVAVRDAVTGSGNASSNDFPASGGGRKPLTTARRNATRGSRVQ